MSQPLYLSALAREVTTRPPIWMMRQAGRYLPEYRRLRQKYPFLELIRTPELATEITLQPIFRYGFDAAILFSDILVVAEALGVSLAFVEGKGPILTPAISGPVDLKMLDPNRIPATLAYTQTVIRQIKSKLGATPLIGFAGAPFTVAAYMLEGAAQKDLPKTKAIIQDHPQLLHQLMDILTEATISYATMQIEAGVDAFQLFDTHAGQLNAFQFTTLCKPYIERILRAIDNRVPTTVFCKGTHTHVNSLIQLPTSAISIDFESNLSEMISRIPPLFAIQGNLDPNILFTDASTISKAVDEILTIAKNRPGFIFNLGHGILPQTPLEHVQLVVEMVKSTAWVPA